MSKNLSDIFPPTEIGGGGGGIEEAPKTGKMYARKDAAWEEFATGNLDDGNKDGEILTWDTATANWTHDDTLIVTGGNVGIGASTIDEKLVVQGSMKLRGANSIWFSNTSGLIGLDVSNTAKITLMNDNTNGSVVIKTNGSERLTIDDTGVATFSGKIASGGAIYRTGQSGLTFTTTAVRPTDGTGDHTTADALLDIGNSSYRFKDAYFSGNVYTPAVVGSNGGLYLAGTDTSGGSVHAILPASSAGAGTDGLTDLGRDDGSSKFRFRNAHFSGTVNCGPVEATGLIRANKGANEFSASSVTAGVQLAAYDRPNTKYTQLHIRASDYKFSTNGSTNSAFVLDASSNAHFSGTVNATTINGKVTDVADHIKAITPTQIANWDAGTGGGGGATTDGRISDTQIIHWDQAYSWGNHASAGYATSGHTHSEYLLKSGDWACSGSITATGNITAYAASDERLKDDIEPMPLGLIDGINPVTFKWKDSGKSSGGVVAQQLQACGLEDWVNEAPNGDLGVDYNALVGVLLAEVLELKARVRELENGNP